MDSQNRTKTLIVVDDMEPNRTLLRRFLERAGHDVLEAADGSEALALIERERIDGMLLDVQMPGLSGFDVLEVLRRTYSKQDLPIVMVSANDDRDRIATARQLGANAYLAKPINFATLMTTLAAEFQGRDESAPAAHSGGGISSALAS